MDSYKNNKTENGLRFQSFTLDTKYEQISTFKLPASIENNGLYTEYKKKLFL